MTKMEYKTNNCMRTVFYLILLKSLAWKGVLCNRPPKFLLDGHSEIVLRLKEGNETPVGTLIYKIKGFDPDGDRLIFGKRNSLDSNAIRIENTETNEANIYLNEELDRETKDEYLIVLTLTDNNLGDGNFITQSLLVLVEDINDNEPIFKPYQSAVEILENSGPGLVATLEATDRDEGAYGQIVYYLQELDGDNDMFSIITSQGKGLIKLVGDLDYERKTLYHLRVLAVDRANHEPINTGTAAILVKVKDVDDQPPEFEYVNPIVRIPEDIPIGTQVVQVKAHDGDRGINNKIKYSFTTRSDRFAINDMTGAVYTRLKLDREEPRDDQVGSYALDIVATEISDTREDSSAKTEITIILLDVNDETPTFLSTYYEAEITENVQENAPLTFISNSRNSVIDRDQGINGTFELSLEPNDNIFEITPKHVINEANFIIRVRNHTRIDYEAVKQFEYKMVARELAKDRRSSFVTLRIFIRDVNDNAPIFDEKQYEFSVMENSDVGTVVGRVKATDIDSGDYGTAGIRYTTLTGSISKLLSLDAETGVITITQSGDKEFDRETFSLHFLAVEARDNLGDGNRNIVQVVLSIQDVNDNAPVFLENKYEANLYENKMNFENILQVRAKDLDTNNQVTYEIIDNSELAQNFTIDALSGIIMPTYPMDFEDIDMDDIQSNGAVWPIYLRVLARDDGEPSLSSNVSVIVYLHDINDNAPQFEREFYAVSILENTDGGTSITRVFAYDEDGSAPNNQIVYRIQKGATDKFVIASTTGVISVAQGANLDPDLNVPKKAIYSLYVVALDAGIGDQQLMATTLVNISIIDVNNKAPILNDPGIIHIKENVPVGYFVFKIQATDLDDSAVLEYSLRANGSEAKNEDGVQVKLSDYNFVELFKIDKKSGTLRVAKNVDRELVEQIRLVIVVEDIATQTDKQQSIGYLTIIVDDENDNNPVFKERVYKRSISENSAVGNVVANIAATDKDKNRTISYYLMGSKSILGFVSLSSIGELSVAKKIDYETHRWLNFTITATDNGVPARSSVTDINIRVLDENDNNPVFLNDTKDLTVRENSPIGFRIGTIAASDADSGDYGKITYLMDKTTAQGKFLIDANVGTITVAADIDREMKDEYSLIIQAWDNYDVGYLSGDSRNAFKQIHVRVLDENDSAPVIQAPQIVEITEYHDMNDIIMSIKVTDADDPNTLNGKTNIALINDIENDLFNLVQTNPWNANVYSKGSLRQLCGNYSLVIQVNDLGSPMHTVEAKVVVRVIDVNDNAPVFLTSNQTMRVPENATIGSKITIVQATDSDIGDNAAILYRLKTDGSDGGVQTFAIDPKTGAISLIRELNRSHQKMYDLHIEAYDQGYPTSLSTELSLPIYVKRVTDYEPYFLVDEIIVNFSENKMAGAEPIELPSAMQRDEVDDLDDPPGVVCYFIVLGNEENLFHLEPLTHVITTNTVLDREAIPQYTLILKATENCSWIEIDPETLAKHVLNVNNVSEVDTHKLMQNNGGLVRVTVNVQDQNDNPPKFLTKVFSGGVTTSANFGSKVLTLNATDLDDGVNARISYYRFGEVRNTLSEGLDHLQAPPFLIDSETGDILLNFDPQKGMKGYFDFTVIANDTGGLQDSAHVFIYLLREDQRVKFILRQKPSIVRDNIEMFRNALRNVTGNIVNVDDFKIHENEDGSVDKTKTDLYIHLVDREDNSIVEVSQVLRVIDKNIEKLDSIFKTFNVLDTQPSDRLVLDSRVGHEHLLLWLVLSNVFLGALLIVILSLCASQRKSFHRELRAASVAVYGSSPSALATVTHISGVPNTNKHSTEGSNPIWQTIIEKEWSNNNTLNKLEKNKDDNFVSINDIFSGSIENQSTIKQLKKHLNGYNTQKNLNSTFGSIFHNMDKFGNDCEMLPKASPTTEL